MPRYYFHVHNGVDSPDHEGTSLPSIDAARAEALMLAGGIIKDASRRAGLGEEWCLTVTDEAGLTLFVMAFMVAETPAAVVKLGSARFLQPPYA